MATTWDATTAVNVALTNGNLTATNTVNSGALTPVQGVKVASSAGKTSGKFYFEITCVALLDSDSTFGVCVTAATYGNLYIDATGGVTAYHTGRVYTNGDQASGSPLNGFSDTDVMAVAVDLDNRKIWFNNISGPHSPGDWNGDAANNPATNVGGVAILSGTIEPFCTFGGTDGDVLGNAFTANFGATGFVGVVPSGFTSGWAAAAAVADTPTTVGGRRYQGGPGGRHYRRKDFDKLMEEKAAEELAAIKAEKRLAEEQAAAERAVIAAKLQAIEDKERLKREAIAARVAQIEAKSRQAEEQRRIQRLATAAANAKLWR